MSRELDLIVKELKLLIEQGIQEEDVVHHVVSKGLSLAKMVCIVGNAYRVGILEAEDKLSRIEHLKIEIEERRKWNDEIFRAFSELEKEDESDGSCFDE